MFIEKTYRTIEKPSSLLELISSVYGKLKVSSKNIKYRPPGLYEIYDFMELYVIGDLHGDFDTLIEIIGKNKILEKIGKDETILLFLGDYIDRGDEQLEVLASILLLKSYYPEKIVLLRGNHEPIPITMPYPHDFPEHLFARFGGGAGTIYRFSMHLFQRLAYVARIPGKILFLHGGPPTSVLKSSSFEEAFSIGYPMPDDLILEEILWNDPINELTVKFTHSPRGAGYLFSREVTEKALELSRTKYIVRGHEAVEGYKVDHDGKIITLFDSKIPIYGISKASYLHVKNKNELDNIIECIHLI